MSAAKELAERCGKARASGMGWMCRCPCHDDSTASLWIVDTTDGGVNVECKAGCDWKTIKDTLGISKIQTQNGNGNHEICYDYRDATGKLLFQKVRRANKKFLIRQPSGAGEWAYNLKGIDKKPLYNLPALRQAIVEKRPVAILEGEKDCDNLSKFNGLVATTNFDGAGKWREEYAAEFKGADVLIFYDRDEPGMLHRDAIVRSLKPVANSINIVHLPELFNDRLVKDFSDWLAAGAQNADWNSLVCELIQDKPQRKEEAINAAEWLLEDESPSAPLLCDVFDKGDKVVIVGKSKTRKSFFALQLALSLAAARSFLGFPALESCRVLLVQAEIKKSRYHARLRRMCSRLEISTGELGNNLLIYNARGVAGLQDELEAQTIKHMPDILIVDPLYKLIAGDENSSEDIKPILRFFDSLAERTGAAVLYVHHDKKGAAGDLDLADRGSGSGILARDFDAGIFLTEHEDDSNSIVVETLTRNYAPTLPFSAQWYDYAFSKSDVEAQKKTSRSGLTRKKLKLPELLERSEKLLKDLYYSGKKEIPMATFNQLLGDAGISVKASGTAVKESLVEKRLIAITGLKGVKGSGVKMVQLLDTLAAPISAIEEREFDYEDHLF